MFGIKIPGYEYCGHGTDVRAAGSPRNELDANCRVHDWAYERAKDKLDRKIADDEFIASLDRMEDPSTFARFVKWLFRRKRRLNV